MARIIIKKTKPKYIHTILLSALGRLKNFSNDNDTEFRSDFIYKNSVIYVIEVHLNGADCILDFIPVQVIQDGKEHYLSHNLSKKECIKLVESLRDALIKYCKRNNLNYIVFPKYGSYDIVLSGTTKLAEELVKINVLNRDIFKQVPLLVDERYDINVIYSPVQKTFYSSQNLTYGLVKDITVFEDYYEFFCDLGDEPIKAGYKQLIWEMLHLVGITGRECNIKWKGKFNHETPGDGSQLILSHASIISKFNLKSEGEKVDTKNLLKGLNSFIKAKFPSEKKRFQELQIFPDQTGCVWFVTEKQLEQLCPIIHVGWEDFPDHCCEVTRAEVLKQEGPKAVLQLCKRNAEREWTRLSNLRWKVYPAKGTEIPKELKIEEKVKK